VNDYAGLLAPAERERLETDLAARERATGAQMAMALFRSLEGENLEDVAERLFRQWRLGQKGLDNGVLLVVFVQDRKLRFEVGYGLEAVLPDAEAGRIIREAIAPRFREQRYAAGLEAGVAAVYARIAPSGSAPPGATEPRVAERRGLSQTEVYLVMFAALVVPILAGLAWEASRQRGLTASRRGWRSSGPGGWYGGGWGGGGWSGGGGDGGFSGGGGSSGGGGASGSW
jgi:uncharacterized protein